MPEFYRRSRLCREGMGSARCSRDRESLSEARWRAGCRVPRAQGLVCGHQVSPPRRPYDRSASASPLKLTTHIFGQNSVPKFVKGGCLTPTNSRFSPAVFPHANDCCVVDRRRDSGRRSWPTPRGAATRQCPPRVRAASGWHVQSDD
jgi:hypothetical protein